jgi:hypothetical protein
MITLDLGVTGKPHFRRIILLLEVSRTWLAIYINAITRVIMMFSAMFCHRYLVFLQPIVLQRVEIIVILPTIHLPLSSRNHISVQELARASNFDLSANVLLPLSQSHFPDINSNFWDLQTIMRLTINPLLSHFDQTIYNHFVTCEIDLPFFLYLEY